jgi:hypothetical protein
MVLLAWRLIHIRAQQFRGEHVMSKITITASLMTVLALLGTPAIEAAEEARSPAARDLALTVTIASQGNQALRQIRSESVAAMRAPAMSLPPSGVLVRGPESTGPGMLPATVRSAE